MRHLFWVELKFMSFGIVSENDVIIDADPIAQWMIGKALKEIKPWLLKQSAFVQECEKCN